MQIVIIMCVLTLQLFANDQFETIHSEKIGSYFCQEAVHKKSGATIVHVLADDPENFFSIALKTPDISSKGTPHIIEHSVLNGSKKYPFNDTFFALRRRSFATYLNAVTASCVTFYPAASIYKEDFFNILDVYLDGIFFPIITEKTFQKEGCRGIVYSEMQGAYSSIYRKLHAEVNKAFFPDSASGYDHGGDPALIPTLTFDEMMHFYTTYYHPSNALFFFYGNIPLTECEDFLEQSGVLDREKKEFLPYQKQTKNVDLAPKSITYDLDSDVSYVTLSWAFDPESVIDLFAVEILDTLLMGSDAALLQKKLLQHDEVISAVSFIDSFHPEKTFQITIETKKMHVDLIESIVLDALSDIAKQSIEQSSIDRVLDAYLFEVAEKRLGNIPEGFVLFQRFWQARLYGATLKEALDTSWRIAAIGKNPELFDRLFSSLFLKNDRYLCIKVVAPEKCDGEKKTVPLPKLSLSAIEDVQAEKIKEAAKGDWQFLYSDDDSGNVVIEAAIALCDMDPEDLWLLGLYVELLPDLGVCGGLSQDAISYRESFFGSFSVFLTFDVGAFNLDEITATLHIRAKCLEKYRDRVLDHLQDMACSVNFFEEGRVEKLTARLQAHFNSSFSHYAMQYAENEAAKKVSPVGQIWSHLEGADFLSKLKETSDVAEKLDRLHEKIFSSHKKTVLTNYYHKVSSHSLFSTMDQKKEWKPFFWEGEKLQLSVVDREASTLFYTAQSFKGVPYSDFRSGHLSLAAELATNCVLIPEIREKNGAYGAGARYNFKNGLFTLYSFRDPNPEMTKDIFYKAIRTICDGDFTADDLEEAKRGVLQKLDKPVSIEKKLLSFYLDKEAGRTLQMQTQFRKGILSATKEEIVNLAATILDAHYLQDGFVQVSGK